jgi:hypothetical protein
MDIHIPTLRIRLQGKQDQLHLRPVDAEIAFGQRRHVSVDSLQKSTNDPLTLLRPIFYLFRRWGIPMVVIFPGAALVTHGRFLPSSYSAGKEIVLWIKLSFFDFPCFRMLLLC